MGGWCEVVVECGCYVGSDVGVLYRFLFEVFFFCGVLLWVMMFFDFLVFDVVVYDFDGMFVDFCVDWNDVVSDVVVVLWNVGVDVDLLDFWKMFDVVDDVGVCDDLE